MTRSFARLALAALVLSGAGILRAQESQAPALLVDPAAPDAVPTTTAAPNVAPTTTAAPADASAGEYCPPGAGNGHGYGAHAANIRHYDKARAQAGYYPNGIENYSDHVPINAYAGPGGCRTCANGQCQYRYYGQPDLFYNYYAWPSCTGWGAELYVSPLPVPAHVGHTYITYQPLMPHEFMYHHHRTYHRYYNGGQGLTRASVRYSSSWFGH
jgi:hypothetical protein